jgi:hypothetical protein
MVDAWIQDQPVLTLGKELPTYIGKEAEAE